MKFFELVTIKTFEQFHRNKHRFYKTIKKNSNSLKFYCSKEKKMKSCKEKIIRLKKSVTIRTLKIKSSKNFKLLYYKKLP